MNNIINDKPWFREILKKPELQDITLRNLYEFYLFNNCIYKIIPIITSNSNISIRVLDWFVTNYSKKFNIIYELNNTESNNDKYFNVFLQYKCQLKGYKKKLFDPFCRKQRIVFHYDIDKCVITTIGQLNFFKWAITYNILTYVENNLQTITNDMITSNKQIIKKYKLNDLVDLTLNQGKISGRELSNSSSNSSSISSNNSSSISSSISSNNSSNKILNINKTKNSSNSSDISDNSESDKIRRKRHELSKSANKSINMHNYSITLSFD